MADKSIHYKVIKEIWDKYCKGEEISREDKKDYYIIKYILDNYAAKSLSPKSPDRRRLERKTDSALSEAKYYGAFKHVYNPGYINMRGWPTGYKHGGPSG